MKRNLLILLCLLTVMSAFAEMPAELNTGVYCEFPLFATGPCAEIVIFPVAIGSMEIGFGLLSGVLFLLPDLSSFAVPVQIQTVFRDSSFTNIELCAGLGMMFGSSGCVLYTTPSVRFTVNCDVLTLSTSIGVNITALPQGIVLGYAMCAGIAFPFGL